MSQPRLPDDPARWPDDPYELLGVAPGVSPRDLKRAYTQLIRIYKPERAPEEFRRVRAAYEHVLRMAEFAERFGVQFVRNRDAPATAPDAAASGPPQPPDESIAPEPRPINDPVTTAWELAVAGDLFRAYTTLRRLQEADPDRAELPLRLYWLLALEPSLEPGCHAATWLAVALRRTGLTGPALELYRQELLERPAEALAAGDTLPDAPAPASHLVDVVEARVRALGRIRRWASLQAELHRVHDRLSRDGEDAWLRLQFLALDYVSWWRNEPGADELMKVCEAEVARYEHTALRLGYLFDRHDLLLDAAAAWCHLQPAMTLPEALAALVPAAWVESFSVVRPLLLRVMDQIVATPTIWLRQFDRLEHAAPTLLTPLIEALTQYEIRLPERPVVPHPAERLTRLAGDFFDEQGLQSYMAMRSQVLEFCVAESVGPEMLALIAPARTADYPSDGATLADALAHDWPLRLVCWAVRLFWA